MMVASIMGFIKMSKRRFRVLVCTIMALILATGGGMALALSEDQQGAISQNCNTIKQSLQNLQRVDSKTRTFLGSTYETLSVDFLTPLNLRLVKNNRPNADLSSIQSNFTNSQTEFKNLYTEYMREMENLINTDCKTEPSKFYDQLETTRNKRRELEKKTDDILKLIKDQVSTVKKLTEEL